MARKDKTLRLPFIYRVWNSYLEPFGAFFALVLALYDPAQYLAIFTPSSTPTGACPDPTYISPHQILTITQTCSLYILFVIMEAVLLHWASTTPMLDKVPEVRMKIWKLFLLACFASDVLYIGASWRLYRICGAEELFWKFWEWEVREWLNLGATWLPLFQRVAFLLGVGLGGVEGKGRKAI